MNFFRSLNPNVTPPGIAAKGELMVWRERILQYFGFIGLGIAVFAYVALLAPALTGNQRGFIYPYAVIMAFFALLVFLRRLPYELRANALLLATLAAAVVSFIQFGLSGNGRTLLLTYTVLAAALLGVNGGLNSLGVSMLTMFIFGFGMTTGFIPKPTVEVMANSGFARDWVLGSAFVAIGAILGITSTGVLIRGLQASLTKGSTLTKDLEDQRSILELRVFQRTQDLQRRLVQIRTAAEISQSIISVLDPETLLQQVADLIKERFSLYYVGVFLLDEKGENAVLHAGTGEAGQKMLDAGHFLSVGGTSMIGWSISNRRARIALDVGLDAVRFSNPYLPQTRSELALPIISRTESIGALTIQSEKENAFDEDDILVLQGIADSLATALENARLFNQAEKNLEEISALNQAYLLESWNQILQAYGPINYSFTNRDVVKRAEKPAAGKYPLRLRNQTIGYMSVEGSEESFSEADLTLIEAVTSQTALALENARLLEESQRRASQEQKINRLSEEFSKASDMEAILRAAISELGQLPSVSEVSVQMVPPEMEGEHLLLGGNGNGRKDA